MRRLDSDRRAPEVVCLGEGGTFRSRLGSLSLRAPRLASLVERSARLELWRCWLVLVLLVWRLALVSDVVRVVLAQNRSCFSIRLDSSSKVH